MHVQMVPTSRDILVVGRGWTPVEKVHFAIVPPTVRFSDGCEIERSQTIGTVNK